MVLLLRVRLEFWRSLNHLAPKDSSHWICIGDLNDISSQSEKLGGRINPSSKFFNLQNFMIEFDMIDMGFKGSLYTWSNGRAENRNVKERLDRSLCNLSCRMAFPRAQVFHLPFLCFDHCPIVLNLNYVDIKTPKVFKFEAIWIKHPDYPDLIKDSWLALNENASSMPLPLVENLDMCRSSLVKWSSKALPNNVSLLKKLFSQLEDVLASEVGGFFSNLFSACGPRDMEDILLFVGLVISAEDNVLLSRDVSAEEIKCAAFQLGKLKAPGPDGYSGVFFQNAWQQVGDHVVKMVQDFFSSDCDVRSINETDIVLIPKEKGGRGDLRGIKLARSAPVLSHCFFTDDSIFSLQATRQNCLMMKWILDAYSKASGQLTNLDKSCIFFSPNTPNDIRDDLASIFGVPLASCPGKYLGVPEPGKRAGIGVIFRDSRGCMLDGCSSSVFASSSFMDISGTGVASQWDSSIIVQDIVNLKDHFNSVSFRWIPRQCNLATDWLAKVAVKRMCHIGWVSSPPSSLALLLMKDSSCE
ncbi:reverse transcriptase [Senna tora]|uniref:Reverse transcriptase n=1 Tax=Senna tora TaxID=362788 RepID=A0A834SZH5_9FABA|nr:reverse transcriptase [Senna tora]